MPVAIYFKVLSLIAWHSYHLTIRFIMSVPRHDYANCGPWAMGYGMNRG